MEQIDYAAEHAKAVLEAREKIAQKETITVQVLTYNSKDEVVTKKMQVVQWSDNPDVFHTLPDEGNYIISVIRVKDVYFTSGSYDMSRAYNDKVLERVNAYKSVEFITPPDDLQHVSKLAITVAQKVAPELVAALEAAREKYLQHVAQLRREEQERKEQQAREAEERERAAYEQMKGDYKVGAFVELEDFISMCREYGVRIPPRSFYTAHQLHNYRLSKDQERAGLPKGKKFPEGITRAKWELNKAMGIY